MTKRFLSILVLLAGFGSMVYADWYNPSWSNRKQITFDYTKVDGATLTDFPVLVSITDLNIQALAQADGDDILFTADDEITKLAHQIEYYNSATGVLRAWVKLPSLSHTTDTSVYLYYGNPASGNQQNASGVWSSGYQAVWHMSDTVSPVLNSASGSFSGTDTNGVTFGTAGIIGNAIGFDGIDDYLDFGDVLDMGTSSRTASAWFKTSNAVGGIFGKSLLGNTMGRWTVVFEDGYLYSIWQGNSGFVVFPLGVQYAFTDNLWHNVTVVYDRTGSMSAYVDGDLYASASIAEAPLADMQTNHLFLIGRYQNSEGTGPHATYIFGGVIDEVRIADTIRSSAWIGTEYNNQFSPSTFIKTIGEEITLPVELSSFTATLSADYNVTLSWTTQSETGVRGYYIYRGDSSLLSEAIAVSPLIDATNTAFQQHYQFTDAELDEIGTYYYWLQAQDFDGSIANHGPTTVYYDNQANQGAPGIPVVTGLSSIYPNPFNPSTTISYGLSKNAGVSFVIYNSRGQIVRRISENQKIAGNWKLIWDGLDDNALSCSTGIYYIRMNAGKESFVKKAVLLK